MRRFRKPDIYPFEQADQRLEVGYWAIADVGPALWKSPYYLTRKGAEIAYWIMSRKTEDEIILHEMIGKDHDDAQHRFYCSNSKTATELRTFVDMSCSNYSESGFSTFRSQVNGLGVGEALAFAGVVRVDGWNDLTYDLNVKGFLLWLWCRENLTGPLYSEQGLLYFVNEADLVKFKIGWINADKRAETIEEYVSLR